ncbi:unnamed protein product [Miscanthus lutarioriparius]|uniref:Uncharacterized protein n=1 Tax=Miscanthus lutarioriparius TaxID=422564 RepID=A0A811S8T0_9POAL|nr:unnamed protein product [Miscanthus lutarioriparius]
MVGVVYVELEAEIGFDAATGPPDLKAGSRAVCRCIATELKETESGGALWTLWKTRNGVIFNGKVLASLKTIIHKTILLVKSWKPLLKPKSQDMADTIQGKLQRGLAEA